MKTYTGGCHCGKVRYEVDTDLASVIECNCSHCYKKGLLLNFVQPEQFRLTEGKEEDLTLYQFNKRMIHHLTCPTCGVESFAWGTTGEGAKMYSINVRCLDGVERDTLTVTSWNGKDY